MSHWDRWLKSFVKKKCKGILTISWDKKSKIMLYGQVDYPYGEPLWKPEMKEGNPIRLYTIMYLNYAKQCDIF